MSSVIVENDRYTVDPLYQWDVNQDLEVRGLSLPSIPEIHFTNDAMERSIVRQATMDDAGIITVKIPNSLLQKPYTIKAYICIYEGDTFRSLYAVSIPVKARKMPTDYTLENDEEIYSFNKLENLLNNTLVELTEKYDKTVADLDAKYDATETALNKKYTELNNKYTEVNAKYEGTNARYTEAVAKVEESNAKLETANTELETATAKAEQSKTDYDSAAKAYSDASDMVNQFLEDSEDILATVQSKANKSTVVEATLSASGWSDNTYSFEGDYPVATHDIEIALNGPATAEQAEAFNSAQIVGSATSNIVTAFGDIPTVDIPIIIKAVAK